MNDLNDIYREYKARGGQKGLHTTHGVPSPYFDQEFEPDHSKINSCPDCGSMNISMDMSTNKLECNECHGKGTEPKKVDFEKKMEKQLEEEKQKMLDAMKRGDTFGTAS